MMTLRVLFSSFTVLLLVIIALGWRWTAAHQPPSASLASHLVLGIAGCAGVFALVKIWSPRR